MPEKEILVHFVPVRLNVRADMTDDEVSIMLDNVYSAMDHQWSSWTDAD